MLKHRVIPCVLLKDWQLTKSVNFKEFRTIGHPKVTARIYNSRNVDELIVLDIDASSSEKEMNLITLKDIADECFMPLTIGGGIKTLEDINALLSIGADKVSLNTIALSQEGFIRDAARRFGSQCIVVSIDVVKVDGEYRIYNKNLGVQESLDLVQWAQRCEELGAGELLITSVDNDGTERGFDEALIGLVSKKVSIPVIANGGAGTPDDFVKAVKAGADAIAAASIFHFSQFTPDNAKVCLRDEGFPVRLGA